MPKSRLAWLHAALASCASACLPASGSDAPSPAADPPRANDWAPADSPTGTASPPQVPTTPGGSEDAAATGTPGPVVPGPPTCTADSVLGDSSPVPVGINPPHTEPMVPKWAFGFMQSYWNGEDDLGYGNQEGFVDHARALRGIDNPYGDHRHPADIMVLDMFWDGKDWTAPGNMTWDPVNFPDPAKMMADLHAMNFKVMMNYHVAGDQKASDPSYLAWVQRDLDYGMDIPWLDYWTYGSANEIAIWDLLGRHFGSDQRTVFMARHWTLPNLHNHAGGTEAGGWIDGVGTETPPNEDEIEKTMPFHWTGDVAGTWGGLAETIEGIVYGDDGAMGGWSYMHSDTPGHHDGTDPELATRWIQFSDFSPFTRNHGTSPRDVWSWGPEVEQDSLVSRRLRYRLLPYLYTYSWHIWEDAVPLTRPMRLAYPGQADEWKYQYMFGEELLVAPVYASAAEFPGGMMDVYLPEGVQWVGYWDHAIHNGGQTLRVDVDLARSRRLPLFVKRGAIVPMGPEIQWIDPSTHPDPLTLDIYPPCGGESSFTLYEDDGETKGYQRGEHAQTTFRVQSAGAELTVDVERTVGTFPGQLAARDYVLKINLVDQPFSEVVADGRSFAQLADYRALLAEDGPRDAWAYDSEGHSLYARFNAATTADTRVVVR